MSHPLMELYDGLAEELGEERLADMSRGLTTDEPGWFEVRDESGQLHIIVVYRMGNLDAFGLTEYAPNRAPLSGCTGRRDTHCQTAEETRSVIDEWLYEREQERQDEEQ